MAHDWTVHAVGGGRQALEHIRRSAYDAVVCDIAMPEMDGFQLTRAMRAIPEGVAIPIILVSAHDADEDRVEGSAAGADAFLSKRDCASGRLLAEVSKVISNKRAQA
jgi:CheY-like chemotaxis protein